MTLAPAAVMRAYTAAQRHAGRGPLTPSEHERECLSRSAPGVCCDDWAVVDAVRAVLLVHAAETLPAEAFAALALECYEQGDAGEQQSWLRALPLLPSGERFVDVAIDACRTNIVPVFAAIACDNPYPVRHFPLAQFNQVVLKAMFVGLALNRIVGLESRHNAELSRMALDYAAERRAAGRTVPADLELALAALPSLEDAQE